MHSDSPGACLEDGLIMMFGAAYVRYNRQVRPPTAAIDASSEQQAAPGDPTLLSPGVPRRRNPHHKEMGVEIENI